MRPYSLLICFCAIISSSLVTATLSPKSAKANKDKKIGDKAKSGPQNYTVFTKNLVEQESHSKDIINNHKGFFREVDEFSYPGPVLGYVTPWNNHGYDIAKIFGNKFTHISPVWLQVRRKAANTYDISGTHDIDREWTTKVRNAGRERKLKIVPRVLFDSWTGKDYQNLISKKEEIVAMCDKLKVTAEKYRFDGYVLEVWTQISQAMSFEILVNLIQDIANCLGEQSLETILVVPPKRGSEDLFTKKHFDALYDYVTAFSLMTYDYSNPHSPGPNAPLSWVQECITALTTDKKKRRKILTGLNFYGNDYGQRGGGPIVSHEYIERLVDFNGKLGFDSKSVENYLEYRDKDDLKHIVFYPTLYSVNKRLELCKELNTGISIWELGQGLDYFYDLL